MTIEELIYDEISKISEEKLEDLYEIVKRFAQEKATETQPEKIGVLAKLKRVKLQGPVDFAANWCLKL